MQHNNAHRHDTSLPASRRTLEAPRNRIAAANTPTGCVEAPAFQAIPVTFDDPHAAAGANGRLPFSIVHISGVHIANTGGKRLFAGALQRCSRGWRRVEHAIIGVKRSEMQGHIRTKFAHEPVAQVCNIIG